jgi:hypothetical protein
MSAGNIPADGVLDAALRRMLPQLLIVLIQRQGGEVTIPVDEIDGTGQYLMLMEFNEQSREFRFVNRKKS